MLIRPAHGQRTSREQHKHYRLAAGMDSLQNLLLQTRQRKIGLVTAGKLIALIAFFALQPGIKTHAGNHQITHLTNFFDLGNSLIALA